jgi:hypothetical protein
VMASQGQAEPEPGAGISGALRVICARPGEPIRATGLLPFGLPEGARQGA